MSTAPPSPSTSAPNPLAGERLYRVPGSSAEQQAVAWAKAGRDANAALIRKIANQPAAKWFGSDPNITGHVNDLVRTAAAAGQLPVLVAYNIPGRDCGRFSAGGAKSSAEYLDWAHRFAAGLGGLPALIILEPDAVVDAIDGCLTTSQADERLSLLKSAVVALSADPKARVYLDAGNPGSATSSSMINALRLAGADTASGLAVNVANFYRTDESVTYGMGLAAALDDRHLVVDTSRNGNGAYTGGAYSPAWCNPPGRALGVAPTTDTGQPLVDAYLWIKDPGDSDGECQHGDPPAGTWWPDYALRLAAGSS
jgi:endoglucanase